MIEGEVVQNREKDHHHPQPFHFYTIRFMSKQLLHIFIRLFLISFTVYVLAAPSLAEAETEKSRIVKITSPWPADGNLPTSMEKWCDSLAENSGDYWEFIKGSPTDDQFFLGMFTAHFTPSSLKSRQWNNKLIGIQYNDIVMFGFENSFYNWCAGLAYARNVYQNPLHNNWDLNIGYRVGIIYGYEDDEAPFSENSPIIPLVQLYSQFIYNKHYGLELMLTSSLSLSFFYQF